MELFVSTFLIAPFIFRALYIRQDDVCEGDSRDVLLKIAEKVVEEYYVAPPGWQILIQLFMQYCNYINTSSSFRCLFIIVMSNTLMCN